MHYDVAFVLPLRRAGQIKQGLQQGIQQGLQQGLLLEAQEMLLDALEERFGIVSCSLAKKIKEIDSKRGSKRFV